MSTMTALLLHNKLLYSVILTFILLINHSDACKRHRKPWHTISDTERMQFVTGFQRLRSNGVLSAFTRTHHEEGVLFSNIHKTSEFFFWHNYFVLELETQIRNLGDEYKCFSMPYYDVTHDAIFEDTDKLPIFDSFLGIDGDINNNHCVQDAVWNIDTYTTEFLCAENEIYPNCCLKRETAQTTDKLPTSDVIIKAMKLKRFREFQDTVSYIHGNIHKFFAATNSSHMFSNNAAEDPLFVLLHSFVVYIRAMRTSCFNFDQIPNDKIEDYMPYTFDSYVTVEESINNDFPANPSIKPTLDTAMQFGYISDANWAMSHSISITPRIMYDISTFDVSYELGTFWENVELQQWCGQNINKTWFYNENDYKYASDAKVILIWKIVGLSFLVCVILVGLTQYGAMSFKSKQKNEAKTKLLQVVNLHKSYGST